jgi:4-amino-4-deoxy-L-arabinose transferase-like glycosyltransferase
VSNYVKFGFIADACGNCLIGRKGSIKMLAVPIRILVGLFSLGLTVRLLFSFWLSKYYFGDVRFRFGDSFSYTESIKNLIHVGKFTFDLNTPDAYTYRGPIYPIFWGIHYLLFGEEAAYFATAVTQSILDAASAILIYLLVMKLTAQRTLGLLCAAMYAIFPTFIVHVPITGTETFAVFVTLLTIVGLVYSKSITHYLVVGVLCGIATMTRQYLGLLVVTSVFFVFVTQEDRRFLQRSIAPSIVALGFILISFPWFLRNWINLDQPTILMGQTPGYAVAQADAIAAHKFYTLFLTDVTSVTKAEPVYSTLNGRITTVLMS